MKNPELTTVEVKPKIETEAPYFDESGKEIKEFGLLKIFHFKGVNDQGRGRKNYYMYKWIRLTEWNGKRCWVAMHLSNDHDYFHLRTVADANRRIPKSTIVQQY